MLKQQYLFVSLQAYTIKSDLNRVNYNKYNCTGILSVMSQYLKIIK